ncbi:oxidoreductase [Methylobacterium radiotolerans]|uniref:Gfo/Idh/MocA family protein n=1 Tax=Methylobacterium TaxID=407 RepID=UPI002F2DBB9C
MISIGIVGYGYWGPNLARCTSESERCQLVAIADQSPAALARAGKRYPAVQLHQDWRDLVADPAIDAVMVATPVSSHFEIAVNALRAGKHVFIEKPITPSAFEARLLIEEAAKRNLTLMVDHTFVYTGAVEKIHELVTTDAIGDVFYYDSTRVNLGLFQRDVNVIWDLAVHDLAILDHILDLAPVAISASGTGHFSGRPENMAHLTVFYPRGVVAQINVNWLAPVKVRQTLIGGSKKMIVYNDLDPIEKVKVYDRGVTVGGGTDDITELMVSYRTGDMWSPHLSFREALIVEIEHFADSIENGTAPMTDGHSGLRVVEMLEAAMRSLRQNGTPIDLMPLARAS